MIASETKEVLLTKGEFRTGQASSSQEYFVAYRNETVGKIYEVRDCYSGRDIHTFSAHVAIEGSETQQLARHSSLIEAISEILWWAKNVVLK